MTVTTENDRCGLGDTVQVSVSQSPDDPHHTIDSYRIGPETDESTRPITIGQHSIWGQLLVGRKIGEMVGLPAGEGNEIFVVITDLTRLPA